MFGEAAQEIERAERTHVIATRKSFVPKYNSVYGTLLDQAARWLLPWEAKEYPGLARGLNQALSYLSPHTILAIRRGRRRLMPHVAGDLADMIEADCERGLAIVKELREAERGPRRIETLGFRAVKDWDGSGVMTDARGKRRRAKKV